MVLANDTVIYEALCLVSLEKEYFAQNGTSSNNQDLPHIRKIFDKARQETLITYDGYWCTTTVTLSVNSNFPPGYYQLPPDYLDTKVNMIIDSQIYQPNVGTTGVQIFKLDDPVLTYIYDTIDLSGVPKNILSFMKYLFLKKLMTRNIYEGPQAQLLQAAYEESARLAQIEYAEKNRTRNLRIRDNSLGMTVYGSGGPMW